MGNCVMNPQTLHMYNPNKKLKTSSSNSIDNEQGFVIPLKNKDFEIHSIKTRPKLELSVSVNKYRFSESHQNRSQRIKEQANTLKKPSQIEVCTGSKYQSTIKSKQKNLKACPKLGYRSSINPKIFIKLCIKKFFEPPCSIQLQNSHSQAHGNLNLQLQCQGKQNIPFLTMPLKLNKYKAITIRSQSSQFKFTDTLFTLFNHPLQRQKRNLTHLEVNISRSSNFITDEGFRCLVHSISHLSWLKSLIILVGCNEISDEGLIDLSNALCQIQSLNCLKVAFSVGNEITNSGVKHLCKALHTHTEIETFRFDQIGGKIQITEEGIESLAETFKIFKKLKSLHLDFGYKRKGIGTKGAQILSNIIQNLKFLEDLHLGFAGNAMTDEGLQILTKSLKSKTLIKNLTFDFSQEANSISDSGLKSLCKAILRLKQLLKISLDFSFGGNSVTNKGAFHLAKSILKLKMLKDLDLNFRYGQNSIQEKGVKKIYKSIKQMDNLDRIYLDLGGFNKVNHEMQRKFSRLGIQNKTFCL